MKKNYYIELKRDVMTGSFDEGFYRFDGSNLSFSYNGCNVKEYSDLKDALNDFNEIKENFKDYIDKDDLNYLLNNTYNLDLELVEITTDAENEINENIIKSVSIFDLNL